MKIVDLQYFPSDVLVLEHVMHYTIAFYSHSLHRAGVTTTLTS